MPSNSIRQWLSLVMPLALILSFLPLEVTAEENSINGSNYVLETQIAEAPETTACSETVPQSESEFYTAVTIDDSVSPEAETEATNLTLLQQIQLQVNDILIRYLGDTDITEDIITIIVSEMDWETYQTARWEISELEKAIVSCIESGQLNEVDVRAFVEDNIVFCNFSKALEEKNSKDNLTDLLYSETALDGQVSFSSDNGNCNISGSGASTEVTLSVTGDMFSSKKSTITITNNAPNASLSFAFLAEGNTSAFKVNGNNVGASGSCKDIPKAGGSVTMEIEGSAWWGTAKVTLSNFVLTEVQSSSQVTIYYDSGSATLDGNPISNGDIADISAEGGIITATATDFVAWIDLSDNRALSWNPSFTLTPSTDMEIKAIHGPAARFRVGDYLFETLGEAADFASSGSNKTIVLANSGTLPAGDYTIPTGVTLLIPFDSSNTLYTTKPGASESYTKPTAYRTLTMSEGANIIVDGAMSLSAKHYAPGGGQNNAGSPTGKVSFVKMEEGSSITVNGALYVYGYITGSGTITANSNASVYENFQIMGYRGGSQSTDMDNEVFAVSQYYVQNIEVPITFYSGAKEYGYSSVNVSIVGVQGSPVDFINSSGALFNLTSGNVTKDYDENTDRLVINLNGTINISSMEIKVSSASINSASFILPLNGNMTINLNAGSSVVAKQHIAFLPGAQLNIAEGATFTLGTAQVPSGWFGTESQPCELYVYDADEWGNYCGTYDNVIIPVGYAPGRLGTRSTALADQVDVSIMVNGILDASAGYLYTTKSGANIYSTSSSGVVKMQAGTHTATYQFRDSTNTYDEISINPAWLLNGDNSGYVETTTGDYYYHAEHKRWVAGGHIFDSNGLCSCGVQAEAQIGSTYYLTLTEAISAATAGGTIKLLANVASASADKCVIINRNGKTANITLAEGLYLCTSDVAYAITKGFVLRNAECCYDDEVILRMKFYIPDAYLQDDYTISLTKDSAWDGPVTTTYTMAQLRDAGPDDSGRYLAFAGVASGEMTRVVKTEILDASGKQVTIYDKAGKELGTAYDFTVKQYVAAALQQFTNEKQKAVANALAVYGGYSQQYFDVSTDNLAYNIEGITMPDLNSITADAINKAVAYNGSEAGIKIKSFEPYLDSATYLRLKFVLNDGENISNYTFKLTGPDVTDATLTASYDAKTDRYYVDICDISAAYLDNDYTVVATNTKTGQAHTVTASVMAWVKLAIQNNSNTNQVNMAKALYWYNQAANAYFPNS